MSVHLLTATQMLDRLEAGDLSSEEIVRALEERIRALDGDLHCFVHRRSTEVLAEARAADEARRRGDRLGPLHGLPLTVKDNIDLVGTDASLGLRARRNQPSYADAPVVHLLKEAGALILGKTNIPQLLLAQETENAIWGTTVNPWNRARVPGGSSGGEAAAIAAGLSPCGIGTDIGGSIRIPAHFCGLAGLKPTLDRWSNRGSNTAVAGQEVVRAQMGPIARTTEDLSLLLRAVDPSRLCALDPAVPPLGLGDPDRVRLEGLRVGCFTDDGFLTPTRAVQRATREARASLEAAGATVVDYAPPAPHSLIYLWLGAITADGGRTIDRQLQGEAISPQLKPSRAALKLPAVARKAMGLVLGSLGEERLARLMECLGEKRVDDLWRLTAERTTLRLAEFDAWNAAGLDAVICPPHVVPAMGHRESGDFTLSLSYAFRWTLLNFPAGVVPVTRVQAHETAPDPHRGVRPGKPDKIEKKVSAIEAASAGLPVGVQVVARPYREDVVLAIMQAIESAARARDGFPTTPVDP
jgi:fatty acid amide hydrolase